MCMRVLVLYPQLFASPIVNILIPLRHLATLGDIVLEHCREDQVSPNQVRSADILVTCRSVDPTFKPIYEYALALGIPIIYDLDDNLLAVPPDSEVYRYFGHPDKQQQLKWLLTQAKLVRVHSPALINVIRPWNEQVKSVWASVDWELVPDTLPELHQPLEIVYAVSPISGAMFYALIRDDIQRVLRQYGERVRFYMLGYRDAVLAKQPNCVYIPFESDYAAFFRAFTRHGYAIGLAPMKYDVFYECKTDIKFRDYAAAGVVGIYTDSPLYQQVQHGITGIIVQNEPGKWYSAIVDLLENPAKLKQIRQAARQFAFQRYHVDVTSQQWLTDLQSLQRQPSAEHISHPERWWFTDTGVVSAAQRFPKVYQLYQRFVPFRLHVLLSRLYHRLKATLAAIPKLPR